MTASAVFERMRERGLTLAVAESLTGGLLTDAFVQVPGSSAVLLGGVVAYATPLKRTLLGVDGGLLEQHGAVHPEVARQMAAGVRHALGVDGPADAGLATTGVAGPGPQDGVDPGTVHVAAAVRDAVVVRSAVLHGGRAAVREQAVDLAVAVLLEALGAPPQE